jgi:hypothetical protein
MLALAENVYVILPSPIITLGLIAEGTTEKVLLHAIGFFNEADTLESTSILIYFWSSEKAF